jgi:hypothetical protein
MEEAWTPTDIRKSTAVVKSHGNAVKHFYHWYLQNSVVRQHAQRLSTPYGFFHVPVALVSIRYNSDRVTTSNNGRLSWWSVIIISSEPSGNFPGNPSPSYCELGRLVSCRILQNQRRIMSVEHKRTEKKRAKPVLCFIILPYL